MIPGPPGRRACTFGVTGFRVTPTVTLMTAPIYFTLPADRAIVCRSRRGPPVRAGDRRRVPRLRHKAEVAVEAVAAKLPEWEDTRHSLCSPSGVAAKAYLDAKGVPKTIGDLHDHNCIGFRLIGSGGVYEWELSEGGKIVTVKTAGTTLVTDAPHARDLALAGVGIAYLLEPLVRRHIRDGRLKRLLPHSAIEEDGLFLYYPRRASLAPKLRAFIDPAKPTSAR